MAKCMQCGGEKKMDSAGVGKASSMAKRKMAKGGSTTNKLNNARGFAKAQTGRDNTSKMIYGVPNAGMTGPNRNSQTETMKKGGVKKSLTKAQKGTIVEGPMSTKKTMFGRTKITKSQEGNYPFETSKSTRTDVYNKKGDWVKQKTKSTVTDKATGDSYTYKLNTKSRGENQEPKRRLNRAIVPVNKKGGSVKKPLRKAQTGRAMTSGPFDKATTDYLNTKYPGTAVGIPYDPEYYAEPQSQSDYTPMAELEANDRRNTEARMRSANNREDFNAGSMEDYRRGGAKKAMMKKGGAVKKMAKGGTKKSFPDMSGDGKVTAKDILMAKGVIKKPKAKFGMSVKVQRSPKAGKVTAVGRGYAAVGKREPGRIIKKTITKKK